MTVPSFLRVRVVLASLLASMLLVGATPAGSEESAAEAAAVPSAPPPGEFGRVADSAKKRPDVVQESDLGMALLKVFDANGNGRIEREEADGKLAEAFVRLDTDGDGALDVRDSGMFRNAMESLRSRFGRYGAGAGYAELLRKSDENEDGRLQIGELSSGLRKAIGPGADADRDGAISEAEFDAVRASFGLPPAGAGPDSPKGRDPREAREHGPGELLRRFDEDGDGKVAVSELPPGLAGRMGREDADGDGWLTAEELRAAARRMLEERRASRDKDDRMDDEGPGGDKADKKASKRKDARAADEAMEDESEASRREKQEKRRAERAEKGREAKGDDPKGKDEE